jgi:TRAP-type mannitol/chloroaromatic compound transport system permease small subunit
MGARISCTHYYKFCDEESVMSLIRLINKISIFSGRLGSLIVLPLVISMVYEVISRYFFSVPTAWAFEISYMMMGSIFMFGISYALYTNTHVNVDFIHEILPKRIIGLLNLLYFLKYSNLNYKI